MWNKSWRGGLKGIRCSLADNVRKPSEPGPGPFAKGRRGGMRSEEGRKERSSAGRGLEEKEVTAH